MGGGRVHGGVPALSPDRHPATQGGHWYGAIHQLCCCRQQQALGPDPAVLWCGVCTWADCCVLTPALPPMFAVPQALEGYQAAADRSPDNKQVAEKIRALNKVVRKAGAAQQQRQAAGAQTNGS